MVVLIHRFARSDADAAPMGGVRVTSRENHGAGVIGVTYTLWSLCPLTSALPSGVKVTQKPGAALPSDVFTFFVNTAFPSAGFQTVRLPEYSTVASCLPSRDRAMP